MSLFIEIFKSRKSFPRGAKNRFCLFGLIVVGREREREREF